MIKHESKSSVLYRYIFSYLIIVGAVVLINGFILYGKALNTLEKDVKATYLNKVQRVSEDLDKQINDMFMTAFEISQNRKFKDSFLKLGVIEESEAIEELKENKKKILFKPKCILYFRNQNVLYTSEGKYLMDIYLSNILNIQKKSEFIELINNGKVQEIIPFSEANNDFNSYIVLTFPISTKNSFYPDATVIFILGRNDVSKRIFDIVGAMPGAFSIYKNQKLLYTSSIDKKSILLELSSGKEIEQVNSGGNKYWLYRINTLISKLDCLYAMDYKIKPVKISDFINDISFIIILLLITGILISVILSYFNYKPIRKLVKIIQLDNILDSTNKNEFKSIEKNLKYVFNSNINLSMRLEKQSKNLKGQAIKYILKNGLDSNINSQIEELELEFPGPNFFVAIAKIKVIDSPVGEDALVAGNSIEESINNSFQPKNIVKFEEVKLEEIVELINTTKQYSFNYVISENDNVVNFIFSAADKSKQERFNTINDIERIFKESGIIIDFGVGLAYAEKSKINLSYYEAAAALEGITSIDGYQIEFFEDIVEKHSDFTWYPSEEVIRYLQSLKQGDEKASIINITSVYNEIKKRNLLKLMERYICYDIVNSFVKTINQLNISIGPVDLNDLASHTNTEELFEKLVSLTESVCASICENTDEKYREFARDIINYVNEHFYEYDISLNKISDIFNVPFYQVSRIFKEANGTGFKEYLVYLRMNKAKSLLKEGCSIKEIAELIGYKNPSHFAKSFKEIEGVSPIQYKKLVEEADK